MIRKYWLNETKGSDKIIALGFDAIYKGNPKPQQLQEQTKTLSQNIAPENMFAIPFSYIKKIEMQEGKDFIAVHFSGESVEHLTVKDEDKKKEIFDAFKYNMEGGQYKVEDYSLFKAAKPQLIALITVIVLYALSIITVIPELGDQLPINLTIVIILASLGIRNLTIIFVILLAILVPEIIKHMRNPTRMHTLFF